MRHLDMRERGGTLDTNSLLKEKVNYELENHDDSRKPKIIEEEVSSELALLKPALLCKLLE